jgi:hypothetical protein
VADRSSRSTGLLAEALDLFETGVAMMRQTLRRRHPHASEAEIDERLREWLHHRPGAESGDCSGRVLDLSRFQ